MKELIDTLKNQGAYSILDDITKQGYAKRTKDTCLLYTSDAADE